MFPMTNYLIPVYLMCINLQNVTFRFSTSTPHIKNKMMHIIFWNDGEVPKEERFNPKKFNYTRYEGRSN